MRVRPWPVLAVVALLGVVVACEPTDSGAPTQTDPPLLPFDSTVPKGTKVVATTEPSAPEPADTAVDDTRGPEVITGKEFVETTDTKPEITATTIDRKKTDLCKAAKKILDVDNDYQEVLAKALSVSADNPDALVKALRKLPLDDIRDAYDDLAAEVPTSLRRKVATIRDFMLEAGGQLKAVADLDELNQLIVELEGNPKAAKATKATLDVSKYTEKECDIALARR